MKVSFVSPSFSHKVLIRLGTPTHSDGIFLLDFFDMIKKKLHFEQMHNCVDTEHINIYKNTILVNIMLSIPAVSER